MLQLMMGLLTKTLNMSEDDLKAIILKEGSEDELNEDALQQLLSKDADRITAIKDANKGSRDDQYKRGLKESAERIEDAIRTAFGLDNDLIGDDLIAAAKEATSNGSGEGMTSDDVKKHPEYIALQTEKSKEIAQMQKDHSKALSDAEGEFNSKMTRTSVNQKAIALIRSRNPILPDDASKANKRLNTILPELAQYKFETNGNEIIVKDENGQLLTDAHNNAVTFDKLVGSIADDYFDFDTGSEGGSTGTGNGGDNFGKPNFQQVTVPQNSAELEKAMKGAKSSEERQKISEAYLENQKASS